MYGLLEYGSESTGMKYLALQVFLARGEVAHVLNNLISVSFFSLVKYFVGCVCLFLFVQQLSRKKEGLLSDCAVRHWLYLELKETFRIQTEKTLNLFLDWQSSESRCMRIEKLRSFS